MSWADDATELAVALRDQFARTVTVVPMIRPPNERPKPDPARPPVETRAIFDDPHRDERLNLDAVKVTSQQPYISFLETDMPYRLTQGDAVLIDGERYEIGDKAREMHGRIKFKLVMVA